MYVVCTAQVETITLLQSPACPSSDSQVEVIEKIIEDFCGLINDDMLTQVNSFSLSLFFSFFQRDVGEDTMSAMSDTHVQVHPFHHLYFYVYLTTG